MPHLERQIWIKNKDNKNFFMAGIDLKEDKAKIEKFVAKTGVSYPILLDTDGAIFELYAEKDAGVTRNVVIDKDGKIAFLTRLFNPEEFNGLLGTSRTQPRRSDRGPDGLTGSIRIFLWPILARRALRRLSVRTARKMTALVTSGYR
jgi:AhpC/TSA family